MFNQTRRVSAMAGMAIVILLAGCEKRTDTTSDLPAGSDASRPGRSMVRVVNAVPGVGALDLFADDINTFAGVAYKTVTPYQGVKDNMVTFQLRKAGTAPGDSAGPLAENRELLGDGDRYTIIALPSDSAGEEPKLRVLEEPTDPGSPGKARIRFVNAARGWKTFDVFVAGQQDAFFDDVDFATEAGFKDLDAMNGSLHVRADDAATILLTVPKREYGAGRTYTFIVTTKSGSARQLEVITIEDAATDSHDSHMSDSAPARTY